MYLEKPLAEVSGSRLLLTVTHIAYLAACTQNSKNEPKTTYIRFSTVVIVRWLLWSPRQSQNVVGWR